MASPESKIMYFILQRMNMKRSIDRYFKLGKFDKATSKRPKRKIIGSIEIIEDEFMHRTVYTMHPKSAKSSVCVLYLHGGAYIYGIESFHYDFIDRLIKTTGCSVILPDYPLAPYYTFKDVYDMIESLYKEIFLQEDVEHIILMGDSAGGGIALGLAQSLKNKKIKQPDKIILLSPWLDVTMENPEIESVDKKDPILGISGLKLAAKAYAGDVDQKDPLISPIYGNMEGLADICLFTSTNDLLNPDARKFKQIMDEKNIDLRYEEYAGLFHDWMLFELKESKDVIFKLAEILKSVR
ncbi:MAG: alpha/beta hydrolase [Firmicutes bacterium HGW-Firmicutes-10]|jgi:acetyl esterase/lipase|nr:MAG: alpha/beta hydrolase [Firmicutes bacterium HGW-Firmicutes-10]